jgi:TldD protein
LLFLGAAFAAPASVGDPIIGIAQAELHRFGAALADAERPPYYLAIGVVDTDSLGVAATHGASGEVQISRSRLADVDVRVGSPALDNTHKIRDGGWFESDGREAVLLPLNDDAPHATQMILWRALDQATRSATRRLLKVQNNAAVKVAPQDESDDFSEVEVVQAVQPVPDFDLDGERWRDTVRAASRVLLDYPAVHDSNVSFQAERIVQRFVSSEGAAIRTSVIHARVSVWASTTADDGMDLTVTDYIDVRTLDNLPAPEAVIAMAERVGAQLSGLRQAPLVEPFVGPAILRGRAAAVFFHEVLGHRVEGHRQKDDDEGQTFTDGVLRNFLMSRSPIAGFDRSNGHGRRQSGHSVVARQGSLLVEATNGVDADRLRQQLIREIRAQRKPYGYIFDDISGGFTFTGRVSPNAFSVQPVTVWRVWADGRPDELVRGVDLIGTPLTVFQRILAAGQEQSVFNGSCGAESGWVPVSAVSPDLLIQELEIQRSIKAHARPPLLSAPMPTETSP